MPDIVVFDAYGTLFDVAAAARGAAAEPGREALAARADDLSAHWRHKQLQYTWVRALAGAHADFAQVTEEALDWAVAATGLDDAELRTRLLALYRELSAYPEVAETLDRLRAAGRATAILSNGSPDMLAAATAAAGIGGRLDAVLSVESVGVYKPHPRVYDMVGERFAVAPAQVLFVSANGWDAAAAAGYGFVSVWVNRRGEPMDRLPWCPAHVTGDLVALPGIAERPR